MSKVVVITLASLVLVGLIAAITMGFITWGKAEDEKRVESSAKAVQAICQPTDYKDACFKSMAHVDTDDTKELVRAAFRSAKEELNAVIQNSTVLQELEKDPKTSDAVKQCRELCVDAMDDLQRSFEGLGEFEWNKMNKVLSDIKVWLSATITYQETCLDGFENTTGDAPQKVREVLKMALEMSSNGLAIVMDLASLLATIDAASFNRRRLLSYLGPRVAGHARDDHVPYFLDKHSHDENGRGPNLGPKVDGHTSQGYIAYWLDKYPYKNRRLLDSQSNNDDYTLLEDDEPDRKRRRRLLNFLHDMGPNDKDELPLWLRSDHHRLLKTTNLAKYLKNIANVVVAKDGSSKYKTIEKALKDIPKNGEEDFIIYIKQGVYKEYLVVEKSMTHVVFVGDGPTKTRITNNKNFIDGTKTYKTATVSITGDFFMAMDIGFENTAGAIKHQAVALRVQADKSIFYNCHMDGYQDTLYVHTYRQFYRNCRVTGTIDFIFGDAAAFFQNCTFVVRKPLPNQDCIVTAQGRAERHQPTGIIIHKCMFDADPAYHSVKDKNKGYLGRPWKAYSRTIILESYIGDFIQEEGWLPWEDNFGLDTCFYSEFYNKGPGARLANRVKWRGVKTMSYDRAERFMPPELFETDDWIKDAGIPYDPTLSMAFAPGMAPDGAPAEAPYAMDVFFPEESSKDNDDKSTGQESTSQEHKRRKSSHKKHKGKSSGDKKHKDEKSSDHEHKGENKDKNSNNTENVEEEEERKSAEQEHERDNKGGKIRDEGANWSDPDQTVVDALSPAPAPAPIGSLDSVEETASTLDTSLRTGEEKSIGQATVHDLERTLVVSHQAFNDGELGNDLEGDVNNLTMVHPLYSLRFPSTEEREPTEALTVHELERMLMANEEEFDHKVHPILSSGNMLSLPKDPIEVHEMEKMLMADEEINGETNDKETEQAMVQPHSLSSALDSAVTTSLSISIPPSTASGPSLSISIPPSIASGPSLSISMPPSFASGPSLSTISIPPSIASAPSLSTQAPSSSSIVVSPGLAPSGVKGLSLAPSISNEPIPAPSTSPSKNYEDEEVHEWLPPKPRPGTEASAPAPELDNKPAADELASTLPSTEDNLGSRFKYESHVILSGLLVYLVALVL